MDRTLLGYASVLDDTTNPAAAVEIVTNDAAVAAFVEERMRALGIRGYVRIEP